MDVWTRCRGLLSAVLGSVGLLVAGTGELRAEPVVATGSSFQVASQPLPNRPALELRRLAHNLQAYAQEVGAELATDFAVASLTMIGGHAPPSTPPPSTPPSTPPPPPIANSSPPPPPPPTPPTTQGGPPPQPPPPTTQGGPPPAATPEPASIVTGLIGLSLASAAGWYKRRKQ